jgi:hypothetical protein
MGPSQIWSGSPCEMKLLCDVRKAESAFLDLTSQRSFISQGDPENMEDRNQARVHIWKLQQHLWCANSQSCIRIGYGGHTPTPNLEVYWKPGG